MFYFVRTRKESISMQLNFDYYYGDEAEQYSFYRIPKVLIMISISAQFP